MVKALAKQNLLMLIAYSFFAVKGGAAGALDDTDAIFQLSLDNLMQQQVSSINKRIQSLEHTPAAIYVITANDIERSSATSLADVLRLAPGVEVAAINNGQWAVSIRKFNSVAADKVLILIDGRTLHPPIYPGVFWENNDFPLELIERIDILRGAGSVIWGNNAMNGVINIITKSAHDTTGKELHTTFGTEQKHIINGSVGWAIDEKTSVRIHAHTRNTASPKHQEIKEDGGSAWQAQNLGFRLDKDLRSGRLLVQGSMFHSESENNHTATRLDGGVDLLTDDKKSNSVNLQLMWEYRQDNILHTFQGFSEYARTDLGVITDTKKMLDLEYTQQSDLGRRHHLFAGIAHRLWQDGGDPTLYINGMLDRKTRYVSSLFIQDDISLIADTLQLTVGMRMEKKQGYPKEFQPNLRLLWTPTHSNSLWLAMSKSVRMPVRGETDANVAAFPASLESFGLPVIVDRNSQLKPEELKAFDIGWRSQWSHSFSTDLTAFVYHYDDVRAAVNRPFSFPPFPDHIALQLSNDFSVNTQGVEVSASWQPQRNWLVNFNYSYSNQSSETHNPAVLSASLASASPKYQSSMHVYHQVSNKVDWSAFLRHVGAFEVRGFVHQQGYSIPSYTALDMRVRYKLNPELSLSLVGKNLLDSRHVEFVNDVFARPAEQIERSVYLKLDWQF
jgi:iron complex outermembrane receptor protein